MSSLSRRSLLRGAIAGTGLSIAAAGRPAWAGLPRQSYPSPTDSGTPIGPRPNPNLPSGTPNDEYPFDHIVVVMQENHSFDNYLGMLPVRGQPLADGFTFAPGTTNPLNENPVNGGGGEYQRSFRLQGTCQPGNVTQAWAASHNQVNGGAMNGFGNSTASAMGYWDEADLPFYYDLAKTFTVGNRSFCSVQGQTYPNRRFLYAGTASGMTSTTSDTFTTVPYPTGGTLFDSMSNATTAVTWKSYFTDLPTVAIIPETLEKYPQNFATFAEFLADATAGTLPSVSFVDTEMGGLDTVGQELQTYLNTVGALPAGLSPTAAGAIHQVRSENGDEEDPADVALGEMIVSTIINTVMGGLGWSKTLIVLTYDEHGGYYDHIAPPRMAAPDAIGPAAGYATYDGYKSAGVRIPTIVVSPWSRANGVSNVVHDHTAIIKTINKKWNLPALALRDLVAPDLFDYVDFTKTPYATPPTLAKPAAIETDCNKTSAPAVVAGPSDGYVGNPYGAPPSGVTAAALPDAKLPVLLPVAGLAGAAALVVAHHNRLAAAERAARAEAGVTS